MGHVIAMCHNPDAITRLCPLGCKSLNEINANQRPLSEKAGNARPPSTTMSKIEAGNIKGCLKVNQYEK